MYTTFVWHFKITGTQTKYFKHSCFDKFQNVRTVIKYMYHFCLLKYKKAAPRGQ